MEQLQYPIGKFAAPTVVTMDLRLSWFDQLSALPQRLSEALAGVTEAELDTPYRPDGWTVRQVVHHLADSHINAYCRLHLALTEDAPTIKPYLEAKWAALPDSQLPIESSLQILGGVHHRWVHLLRSMGETDFAKTYVHPQYGRVYTMDTMTALYAWHGEHHLGHVRLVVQQGSI